MKDKPMSKKELKWRLLLLTTMIGLIWLFASYTIPQIWWGAKTLFFHYLFWLGFSIFCLPLIFSDSKKKEDQDLDFWFQMLFAILATLFTFIFYTTQLKGM